MSRNLVIVLALIVLIGGGVFFGTQTNKEPELIYSETEKIKSQPNPPKNQNLDNNSKYVEYSKETLDRASSSRRVLYFYASWCPTCRPADADFRTNLNKFPEDLVLIRVNYNDPDTDQEEKDLAKKYAVTYQHTFVQIDAAGAEIKKWNGGQTEELLKNIK